ncbi:hypothetical protein M422DRAFT_260941, partial [Sphaerobolus stellatus SS14]
DFDYAKFIQQNDNTWKIVFQCGPPPALRCSLWAPLIDECDIQILDWFTGEVKYGIWNNQEVIVKVACSPLVDENLYIASQSEAYRFTHSSGLTPHFLGHLVRSGVVIGFVLEVVRGRSLRKTEEDRKLLRAALEKLFSWGTIHSDLNWGNLIVSKDGIRFIDFDLIAIPPDMSTDIPMVDALDRMFEMEMWHFDEDYVVSRPDSELNPPNINWEEMDEMDTC